MIIREDQVKMEIIITSCSYQIISWGEKQFCLTVVFLAESGWLEFVQESQQKRNSLFPNFAQKFTRLDYSNLESFCMSSSSFYLPKQTDRHDDLMWVLICKCGAHIQPQNATRESAQLRGNGCCY